MLIKIIKLVSIAHDRQAESSYSAFTVHTLSLCCGCVMDTIISSILNRYQLVYEYNRPVSDYHCTHSHTRTLTHMF